jgi:Skp family chaperone for outer membrane proteins
LRVPVVPPLRLLFLATALIVCACSSQHAPQAPAAPSRAPDRFIYVSAQDVPSECYHDLGGVTFTEPYTSAAMDGDGVQMATKLRALAIEKYPDEADAVINVQTQQNDIGTIVTVTGEVVELHQGHTVECAMRKAPGVLDRTLAVAAGGMLGAAAGAMIPGAGTAGIMGGAAVGVGTVGTYTAVTQHRETLREQAQLKSLLATQQSEITRLLAKRSSLQKCADDDVPLANCKISDTITAASDSSKSASDPSYETEQPQFELQKQVQQQQGYIRKLRDQVFELQQQLGGH